jgi:hypothetical protein
MLEMDIPMTLRFYEKSTFFSKAANAVFKGVGVASTLAYQTYSPQTADAMF